MLLKYDPLPTLQNTKSWRSSSLLRSNEQKCWRADNSRTTPKYHGPLTPHFLRMNLSRSSQQSGFTFVVFPTTQETHIKFPRNISVNPETQQQILQQFFLRFKAFLGASLSRGSSLWIDGRKAEGGNVFKFSDGSVVDASWMSSSDDGDCLSLEVSTATVTWHRRSCFDKLKGYICQYQASSVNKT